MVCLLAVKNIQTEQVNTDMYNLETCIYYNFFMRRFI